MPVLSKNRLSKALAKATAVKPPLWEGPDGEGPNGGVTQSLLSRFLCCRERFRLLVVEGLRVDEGFNLRLEYGNLWHTAEEAFCGGGDWEAAALKYATELRNKYKEDQREVWKWYRVLQTQFPSYIKYWKKHKDVVKKKPVFQEEVFNVPYKLPSGRVVRLRGKWDAIDLIERKLWIQENKAKGDVEKDKLQRELPWDLQSNIYLTALTEHVKYVADLRAEGKIRDTILPSFDIGGVRYNVVRRPLSGGKFSIRQKQAKGKKPAQTEEEFYEELRGLIDKEVTDSIKEDRTNHFFFRVKMETEEKDIARFQTRCTNPILESLWDWWEWIKSDPHNPWREGNRLHFQYPTGVWNPLLEGRSTDLDTYINTGDDRGLEHATTLFRELENA